MESKCYICNAELDSLEELERLSHINSCLDKELEKAIEIIDPSTKSSSPQAEITPCQNYDLSGMPNYENMSLADLKKSLDEFGMKKTIEPKFARVLLKETWIYSKHGVFPNCLSKYL